MSDLPDERDSAGDTPTGVSRRRALTVLGAAGVAGLAGCGSQQAAGQEAAAEINVIQNPNFISDAAGNGPGFDDDTVLFDPGPESIPLNEIIGGNDTFDNILSRPLTDSRRLLTRPPEGYDRDEGYDEPWEPVVWGDYREAAGEVTLNHNNAAADGTEVQIDVTDAIPQGRYTVWVVKFAALSSPDEFDAFVTPAGNGLVGFHNLGPKSDSRSEADNIFTTDSNGDAQFTRRNEGGSLSGIPGFQEPGYPFVGAAEDYEQADDALTQVSNDLREEDEIHFVGAYHYDDQTWGTYPGPWHVNHFDARFQFSS